MKPICADALRTIAFYGVSGFEGRTYSYRVSVRAHNASNSEPHFDQ